MVPAAINVYSDAIALHGLVQCIDPGEFNGSNSQLYYTGPGSQGLWWQHDQLTIASAPQVARAAGDSNNLGKLWRHAVRAPKQHIQPPAHRE